MTKTDKPRLSRPQLLAKLKEMNDELVASNEREGARLGRLAVEAGLADLELSDRELRAGFGKLKDLALAGEFRGGDAKSLPSRRPSATAASAPAAGPAAGQKSAA
jgi:hypothetical protein